MNGLHEVVRHIISAQRGMGYERSGLSVVSRDALLHVNRSYSDSQDKAATLLHISCFK
jgi:hypothetical protein